MYTKSTHRDKSDIIIPENYSGNAFSPGRIVAEEVAKPSDGEIEEQQSAEKQDVPQETEAVAAKPQQSSLLSSLMPPKMSYSGGILSNIGLEELLLVGILILLSQSDTDDDIILLLFLLLFYK